MFLNHIYRHARESPDRIAVVNCGERISYRRFALMIDAVRSHLRASALPTNGMVVIIVGNLFRGWLLQLALNSLGRTTIAVSSWKAATTLDLRDLAGTVHFDGVAAAAIDPPEGQLIVVPKTILNDLPADHPLAPIEGSFGDHILYTSGSTGRSRKLRFRGDVLDELIRDGIGGAVVRSIGPSQVYHGGKLPSWTIVGYRVPLAHWYHGATVVFEQRADWTGHFFDHPVTTAVLMPPVLRELCLAGRGRPAGHPPLRMITGGGFIDVDLVREAVRQLRCALVINYGGSETRVVLESRVRIVDDIVWLTPLFEGAVDIVDEDDVPVPPGDQGIVRIRSAPTDPHGYVDDPEATATFFRDGFFYPGDMGVAREDGRIRILGRAADVLTVSGRKIMIGPIERRIRGELGVESLCLFARQTDGGGSELLVVIEGDSMPDAARCETVIASTSKDFARTRFVCLASFPRSDNGMMKIKRREVLRLATESADSRASGHPGPSADGEPARTPPSTTTDEPII